MPMKHITLKKGAKYFYIIFFIIISIISFFMLRPFTNAIIMSIIVTYIFYPIYRKLSKIITNKNLSALIMIVLVFLIVVVPSILFVQLILQQFRSFSVDIKEIDASLLGYADDLEEFLNLPSIINLEAITEGLSSDLTRGFTNIITNFIKSIPFRLLEMFIIIFISFYLFRDGERLLNSIKRHIPIKNKYKEEFFSESAKVTKAVIYGTFVAAVAQGVAGAIGFYIFGIDNYLIWGLVMTIFALFPFLGPVFIWLPTSIFFLITDQVTKGILLFIYGALFISSIDNVIKAGIISKKARIHQVIILLGLVGGLSTFGVSGIVMGPLILSLLIVFIKIYLRENQIAQKIT